MLFSIRQSPVTWKAEAVRRKPLAAGQKIYRSQTLVREFSKGLLYGPKFH